MESERESDENEGKSSDSDDVAGPIHESSTCDHLPENTKTRDTVRDVQRELYHSEEADIHQEKSMLSLDEEGEESETEINHDHSASSRHRRRVRAINARKDTADPSISSERNEELTKALHALTNGKLVTVYLTVNNKAFDKDAKLSTETLHNGVPIPKVLGNDGNQFYCQVCRDFGNVVCCDGCPRVYHHMCIPTTDLSRQALDNDNDPWFCPVCMKKKKIKAPPAPAGRASERRIKRKCTECQRSGGELAPCENCGASLHYPSCRISEEFKEAPEDRSSVPLCSNCRVEAVVGEEEMEFEEEGDFSQDQHQGARKRSSDDSDADDESQNGVEYGEIRLSRVKKNLDNFKKKKNRPSLLNELPAKSMTNENKKKTKGKRSSSISGDVAPDTQTPSVKNDHDYYANAVFKSTTGLVKSIPAFFFFLNDSRSRIERVLSKKHRYFNRLPKGVERNELIAKEGARWWTKLSQSDQKRFVNTSIQDFEERVIQWKENKTIQEMLRVRESDEEKCEFMDFEDGDAKAPEEQLRRYQYHHRLYLATSVGSKPFTPEQGKSNNRVLLELLQDIRFHPLPMLSANRTDLHSGEPALLKACIPHFDVHGPVATCVGDECLGCTRGWNHHCSVVKRRLPAIERRARLQPPLSSLLASRVGLGLKPKIRDQNDLRNDDFDQQVKLFEVRETKKAKEEKLVPPIPSFTLRQPSTRVDDVVLFIEEALAMKVPEPPRPSEPYLRSETQKKATLSRGRLPFSKKQRLESNGETPSICKESDINRCGRCRAIIRGDTGCVQCRRAQLVINTSKKSASYIATVDSPPTGKSEKDSTGFLKVQTAMLGRLSSKECNFDDQSESDKRFADAIVNMLWSPCAVLPPSKTLIPTRRHYDEVTWESQHQYAFDAKIPDSEFRDLDGGASHDSYATADIAGHIDSINENDSKFAGLRRQRSARLMAAASILALCADAAPTDAPSPDRQQIALEHKEESKELLDRCVRVACSGILLAMMRRDPLRLFAEPVGDNIVGYSTVVSNPIDFSIIRARVLKCKYVTLGGFVSDARQLCKNALAFNPPGSIYFKTATELLEVVEIMQERATRWISTVKNAHSASFSWRMNSTGKPLHFDGQDTGNDDSENDPFKELRKSWPDAVEMLETGEWLMEQISSDLVRTKENENAYYGSIAVQRAAAAAEASLAPYPDAGGVHSAVANRNHTDDEQLRRTINNCISQLPSSLDLSRIPSWREETLVRILRRVQSKRVEGRTSSENGCARCDGVQLDPEDKMAMTADAIRWGRNKKKGEQDTLPRVAESRLPLTTGNASMNTRERIDASQRGMNAVKSDICTPIDQVDEDEWSVVNKAAVSVRGSRVHGWGLFADQSFRKGAVVAEYVGEYISNAVADAREKMYQERRIQDYQFRVDESLVIDATLKGGHGRYINHSCSPSCIAKIFDGKAPNTHLKRVIIIAQRDINSMEEITYDYQFPLELDLDARIPCNCGSELCRGFMNWDLPEKGSKSSATRAQKRGGNMRDRIRRLGKKTNKKSSP